MNSHMDKVYLCSTQELRGGKKTLRAGAPPDILHGGGQIYTKPKPKAIMKCHEFYCAAVYRLVETYGLLKT